MINLKKLEIIKRNKKEILNYLNQLKNYLKENCTISETREVERPMSFRRFTYLGWKLSNGKSLPLSLHIIIIIIIISITYHHYNFLSLSLLSHFIILDITFWRRNPWHQRRLYSSTKPDWCQDDATWTPIPLSLTFYLSFFVVWIPNY